MKLNQNHFIVNISFFFSHFFSIFLLLFFFFFCLFFSVLLIGESWTGKSNIFLCLQNKLFNEHSYGTIGVSYARKSFQISSTNKDIPGISFIISLSYFVSFFLLSLSSLSIIQSLPDHSFLSLFCYFFLYYFVVVFWDVSGRRNYWDVSFVSLRFSFFFQFIFFFLCCNRYFVGKLME